MSDSRELAFAKELAKEAGDIMHKYFQSDDLGTVLKGDNSPVTLADTTINDMVIDRIHAEFPGHSVVGEEASSKEVSEYVWYVDPIDGTRPFAAGVPTSTFTIGLAHKGVLQVGVIYDPWCDRLFWAERGKGAWLNGKRLELQPMPAGKINLELQIWSGSGYFTVDKSWSKMYAEFDDQEKYYVYHLGSVAYSLAMMARGELQALVFTGNNPWDTAGGHLLLEEVGITATDMFGDPVEYGPRVKGLIAAHPDFYETVLAAVRRVEPMLEKERQ